MSEQTVPIFEIAPDWTIDDIETADDCDDAHAVLIERIAVLEGDLAEAKIQLQTSGIPSDGRWFRQATMELRLKKGALQAVQAIRSRVSHERKIREAQAHDRRFLELFKEIEPDAYQRVCAEAQRRWPHGRAAA